MQKMVVRVVDCACGQAIVAGSWTWIMGGWICYISTNAILCKDHKPQSVLACFHNSITDSGTSSSSLNDF